MGAEQAAWIVQKFKRKDGSYDTQNASLTLTLAVKKLWEQVGHVENPGYTDDITVMVKVVG